MKRLFCFVSCLAFCIEFCLCGLYAASGPANLPVNLSEKETANCYMVPPGAQLYCFDATVKGNGIAPYGEDTAIRPENVRGVRLLWQDADVIELESVSFENGTVCFRTTAAKVYGNAVIALYSGPLCLDGECIWSWHIWMTQAADTSMSGIVFLDRNLGADAPQLQDSGRNGLFYQWGRKDPFPQTGAIKLSAPGKASPEFAASHPQTFIVRSGRWMSGETAALWCKGARREQDRTLRVTPRTKTMYDPCPPGYHVPNPADILVIRASGTHSFIKAGARWYDMQPDVPDKTGEFGYYWTAMANRESVSSCTDYYIWDEGSGIAMKSYYYNGSAFTVRPQKF